MRDPGVDDVDYVVCHDQLYSAHALLSKADGAIVERYDYDAYGSPYIYTADGDDDTWFTSDDTTADHSAKGLAHLFTGRQYERLDTSRLQYSRARYLNVSLIGPYRWMQRDPLEYIDGMNLYEYANNTPIVKLDPMGLTCGEGNCAHQCGDVFNGMGAGAPPGQGCAANCPPGKKTVICWTRATILYQACSLECDLDLRLLDEPAEEFRRARDRAYKKCGGPHRVVVLFGTFTAIALLLCLARTWRLLALKRRVRM